VKKRTKEESKEEDKSTKDSHRPGDSRTVTVLQDQLRLPGDVTAKVLPSQWPVTSVTANVSRS